KSRCAWWARAFGRIASASGGCHESGGGREKDSGYARIISKAAGPNGEFRPQAGARYGCRAPRPGEAGRTGAEENFEARTEDDEIGERQVAELAHYARKGTACRCVELL